MHLQNIPIVCFLQKYFLNFVSMVPGLQQLRGGLRGPQRGAVQRVLRHAELLALRQFAEQ